MNHRRFWTSATTAALLTPVALSIVALGQTALLGAGALVVVVTRVEGRAELQSQEKSDLLAALVFCALCAKPPLALTAAAALLAGRHGRTLGLAAVLCGLIAVTLTPMLGSSWPVDYARLIANYDVERADPVFAWSLHPATMSNLRAFLTIGLGLPDATSSKISNAAWIGALAGLIWTARRRRFSQIHYWPLAIISYLLFCSHVSFTEDVLLLLIPALTVAWNSSRERTRQALSVWLLVPIALLLSPGVGPLAEVHPAPLLFVKFLLAGGIVRSSLTGVASEDSHTRQVV